MRDNKENTDNKMMNVQPEEAKNEETEEYQEIILTEEMLESLGLSGDLEDPAESQSDMVPLPILELDLEKLKEMKEFQQGVKAVAKLCGEIAATSNAGLPTMAYIQHKEQMAIIEMNKEIAKVNAEVSKDMKKKIENSSY